MSASQPSHEPKPNRSLVPEVQPLPSTVGASPDRSVNTTTPQQPATLLTDAPRIPGYRIIGEIARGGMGRIFAAFDETLEREVAIKTLLPRADQRRFITEAKITARLPHPGIPPVHALGTLEPMARRGWP
jgi:serine/threonine protein kinase